MKSIKNRIAILCLIVLLAALALSGRFQSTEPSVSTATIGFGSLDLWITYEGITRSRTVETIISRYSGSATITDLIPEGSLVKRGDVLATLDSSKTEWDLLKLERDYALARVELESMKSAVLPIEERELELEMLEMRATYEMEKQYLQDTVDLCRDNLVSDGEVSLQEQKVGKIEEQLKTLELRRELMNKYLHPLALERARANLASAEQAVRLARRQLAECTIRSPSGGTVVYKPLHIGGEFRTIRVGDSVYENQPFMEIPDMANLEVHCYVPEAELSKVGKDNAAIITPVAYPDMKLHGTVGMIASMAQPVIGRPNWQKYFHVLIELDDPDPRLRAGMSTHVIVLSYSKDQVLLVPRAAITWQLNTPYCRVVNGKGGFEMRKITVGKANEIHYEVVGGLEPGDEVLLD